MPPKRTTAPTRAFKRLKRTTEEPSSIETSSPVEVNETYLEISIPDPTIQATEEHKEVSLNDGKTKQASNSKEEKASKRKPAFDRALRLSMRRVHMLSLLISFQYHSRVIINDPLLQALCLSIVPPHLLRQFTAESIEDGRTLVNSLSMLANWWKNSFGFKIRSDLTLSDNLFSFVNPLSKFQQALAVKSAYELEYICMFAMITRALGLTTRLVNSLKLLPVNPALKEPTCKDDSSFHYIPNTWLEFYHPRERRWFPVDCIRTTVNCRQSLELNQQNTKPKNAPLIHTFVAAFEEDGYIKDVTKRYCPKYYGSAWRLRLQDEAFFEDYVTLLNQICKPHMEMYDESAELESFTESEPIPDKLTGFHLHGKYVLESKLKKYEVFWPAYETAGEFKGEKIHLRQHLHKVRSKDAWYTQYARTLKENAEPVKIIQLPKKKKKGMLLPDEDPYEPGAMQPLYGEWQTDPFIPPKAINGKVPRNSHGNVDLFKMEMLPDGCAYIPYNAAWKSARDLGVDYANACVRFAFHGRMAVPNIQGIVVCKEDENKVLLHYYKQVEMDLQAENAEMERQEFMKKRREALAIKISTRLNEDYLSEDNSSKDASGIQSAFHTTSSVNSDEEDFVFD